MALGIYFYCFKNTSYELFVVGKEEILDSDVPSYQANLGKGVSRWRDEYQNEDIKATISLDNDDFLYPVVQTLDNQYYLNHDYSKNKDSLGTIYADYRVNLEGERKILIFGHSSVVDDVPFNCLEKYYDESFFQNHQFLTLETENNRYSYEFFSVYIETENFSYMNLNFDSDLKWLAHLKIL